MGAGLWQVGPFFYMISVASCYVMTVLDVRELEPEAQSLARGDVGHSDKSPPRWSLPEAWVLSSFTLMPFKDNWPVLASHWGSHPHLHHGLSFQGWSDKGQQKRTVSRLRRLKSLR